MDVTKLIPLTVFSFISLCLHALPIFAQTYESVATGDGYFICNAPMTLSDGSIGCGDAIAPSPEPPISDGNLPDSSCLSEWVDCVDRSFENPSYVRGFGQYLQCHLQVVGCARREMSGENN